MGYANKRLTKLIFVNQVSGYGSIFCSLHRISALTYEHINTTAWNTQYGSQKPCRIIATDLLMPACGPAVKLKFIVALDAVLVLAGIASFRKEILTVPTLVTIREAGL